MADKRRRTVATTYGDDNTVSLTFYNRPDDTGAQAAADTASFTATDINEAIQVRLMLIGVNTIFANAYNKLDNPDAADVRKVYDDFIHTMKDGSWQPGRQFESEPSDLELAVAEATAKPLHVVQNWIEEQLALVQKNPDGSIVKDKGGRVVKVHRKSAFEAKLAADSRIKPILARLMRERAAKLAAEARSDKSAPVETFGGLFDSATAEAAQ